MDTKESCKRVQKHIEAIRQVIHCEEHNALQEYIFQVSAMRLLADNTSYLHTGLQIF